MSKLLVAGPCVIERDGAWLTEVGMQIKQRLPITGYEWILKASFRKGNRTKAGSFEGIGTRAALSALAKARDFLGVKVCTDVHSQDDIYLASYYRIDVIQIPERLCRDTALLETAASQGSTILLKCGLSMSPAKYRAALEKLEGAQRVIGCYRGTAFGDEVIFDIGRLMEMSRRRGFDVTGADEVMHRGLDSNELIADVTHSTQCLGDTTTFARRERTAPYARAAAATGFVDGIFAEVHPDPENALSDAESQLSLSDFEAMVRSLKWA